MLKKQTSIQDLLLQEDHSSFSKNSIPKVQELNKNVKSLETEDQSFSTMPPKIFLFKSMNVKNQNCNKNEINDYQSNIKPKCMDSQMNPIPLDENKASPITISPTNNLEVPIPTNSQTPNYPLPLPSSLIQNQPQKNSTTMPQINAALKIPDTYKSSPSNSRIRWTKQEDEQLMSLVKKWGARKWNEIASSLGTKTAKQCRDHYANCLDPEIKNSLWTVEEEQILLSKYEQLGPHWSRIKSFLPGRTTSMIKNYITMLLKKCGKEVSANTQTRKENLESNTSSANSCSENDEHDNYYLDPKNMGAQKDDFTIHDINFLLNRPANFTGPL